MNLTIEISCKFCEHKFMLTLDTAKSKNCLVICPACEAMYHTERTLHHISRNFCDKPREGESGFPEWYTGTDWSEDKADAMYFTYKGVVWKLSELTGEPHPRRTRYAVVENTGMPNFSRIVPTTPPMTKVL